MQFQQYDLGQLSAGRIVEVQLSGSAANVRLLDSSNFQSFKSDRSHRYTGGHYTRSPVRLQTPSSGHWYVVIDLGGHAGRVKSSVRVLPGALPRGPEAPLSSVPSLVQGGAEPDPYGFSGAADSSTARAYDVFISHASEDKAEVVRGLALALQAAGLRIWYDEFELGIGDSLRRKIDRGLATSRFGVIVLSRAFFAKGWTNYELDGLVTRANTGEQVLLPIWHNITKQEVIEYSPSMADKVARSTTTHTIQEIADEIVSVVQRH